MTFKTEYDMLTKIIWLLTPRLTTSGYKHANKPDFIGNIFKNDTTKSNSV